MSGHIHTYPFSKKNEKNQKKTHLLKIIVYIAAKYESNMSLQFKNIAMAQFISFFSLIGLALARFLQRERETLACFAREIRNFNQLNKILQVFFLLIPLFFFRKILPLSGKLCPFSGEDFFC
jgi:hypothetical protein